MNIKIVKTEIEVNLDEFRAEVGNVCRLCKNANISQFAAKFPVFKRELGLKLTELQFFDICMYAGIEVRRNAIRFDQFGIS
jgi:hypothetical protein